MCVRYGGRFPKLKFPMGGETTQSRPEVWPSCISSLPGARLETFVGLAGRPGWAFQEGQLRGYTCFPGNCAWGGGHCSI